MKFATSVVVTTLAVSSAAEAASAAGAGWTKAGLERRLFEPMTIVTYTTGSQVTDHCAIDQDQNAIEEALATKDDAGFAAAKRIYKEGGFSKSYAEVTLSTALAADIGKGDEITGVSSSGEAVAGKAYADTVAGTTALQVQYATSDDMETYMNCKVGGLPTPVLDGCFADSGSLTINGTEYPYTYDQTTNNKNGRTIEGFSTGAQAKMGDGQPDNHMFAAYADYYGTPDYADKLIQAAFDGTATSFTNGNQDFSTMGFDGKEQIIKKATAYMSVLMYITYEFEDALIVCKQGTGNEGEQFVDDVHAWDEGVCFYTGSLGFETGEGVFPKRLAEKRCVDFGTCNEDESAKLNDEIFELFVKGNEQIMEGDCDAIRETNDEYYHKMIIPLMQGTMAYAYEIAEFSEAGEKEKAEGAVFMAAVVPAIHHYDPAAAMTIYENMKFGATTPDYMAVKSAFESIYPMIDVTCEEIGGFMDENGTYYPGMEPCGATATATDAEETPTTSGAASLLAFAAQAIIMITAVVGFA